MFQLSFKIAYSFNLLLEDLGNTFFLSLLDVKDKFTEKLL